MKAKYIFFSYIMIISSTLVATGQELEEYPSARYAIESFFSELVLSNVPTGLLKDYATELADLEPFNGVLTDSNYVSIHSLEYIMRTLRSSSVTSTKPIPAISTILEEMDSSVTETFIPVCAIASRYNYFWDGEESVQDEALMRFIYNEDLGRQ